MRRASLGDVLAGEYVVLNDGDEIEEFFFRERSGRPEGICRVRVAPTLGNVDRDVDVFLVGGDSKPESSRY